MDVVKELKLPQGSCIVSETARLHGWREALRAPPVELQCVVRSRICIM